MSTQKTVRISQDLDKLLLMYFEANENDRFDDNFMRALRRLIIKAQNGQYEYNQEREKEWRRIAYALGDNETEAASFGYWADIVEQHAEEIRKVIKGGQQ